MKKLTLTTLTFLTIFLTTSTASAGYLDDLWKWFTRGRETSRHHLFHYPGCGHYKHSDKPESAVPEPGAALLFGAGALLLTWRMRQAKK